MNIDPILALTVDLNANAVIALLAGIIILIRPSILAYVVAIYLIIVGILGIFSV